MELLDKHVHESNGSQSIQLSPVLDALADREKYLAVETKGRRYPVDTRYGLLTTQLALALTGVDREQVLTELVSLLTTVNGKA
jgi:UTP--glucose-1-phosphate uridylyltransferase